MDEHCIICANGNDLPDGECCRACGRRNGPASHDDELDALRQHLCRHSIRDHYASATVRVQELEAEIARVREERDMARQALKEAMQRAAEQAKWIIDAQKDKERVARRAFQAGVQWQFDQLVPFGFSMVSDAVADEEVAKVMRAEQ